MIVNVQVLCSACKNCDKFKVEQTDLLADNRVWEKLLYCENVEICKKAVEIWEKQSEIADSHRCA